MRNQAIARAGAATGVLLAGLCLTRLYSYLLFHTITELFTIAVAVSVFFLAWNARRFLENHYLLFIGIASLFGAAVDSLHTISYKGMGVFPGGGADLPTQLWVIGRYVQSLSFLAAALVFRRAYTPARVVAAYCAGVSLLIAAVFSGFFPACFVEGFGLTKFKLASEYAAILVLLVSAALLSRLRSALDEFVWRCLVASILLNAAAGLAFTLYADVYGIANMAGHLFRFVAYCFIYRAIIVTGLARPYDLLFRNLAHSEAALRAADERYRAFLTNSSEGICRLELREPLAAGAPEDEQVAHILRHARVDECNDAIAAMHGCSGATSFASLPLAKTSLVPEELLRMFVRSGYRLKDVEYSTEEGGRSVAASLTGVVENGRLVRVWAVERDVTERKRAAAERERLIAELRQALAEVKTLAGLLPICANCRKIRDDKGYWQQVESYLEEKAGVSFSHGICPDCLASLYPEYTAEIYHDRN